MLAYVGVASLGVTLTGALLLLVWRTASLIQKMGDAIEARIKDDVELRERIKEHDAMKLRLAEFDMVKANFELVPHAERRIALIEREIQHLHKLRDEDRKHSREMRAVTSSRPDLEQET